MSMTEHSQASGTVSGSTKPGRGFTIGGAICAVVALVFLPIILGPIGAVLGFVGYSKGDKPGLWVGIGGIVAAFLGMVIAAAVIGNGGAAR